MSTKLTDLQKILLVNGGSAHELRAKKRRHERVGRSLPPRRPTAKQRRDMEGS